MKILVAHNYYQQAGGEDEVFASEADLLAEHGHEVTRYITRNHHLQSMSKIELAAVTMWNTTVYDELRDLVRKHRPEVVHFHNTFPLMSPAAYYGAASEGAAIVQTLHNYRLICPAATLFRDGKPCENCVGRAPWPAAIHGCYRASRSVSTVASLMVSAHRALGTWRNAVDLYITLTKFARRKFIDGGMPARRLAVKPNFVHPDPQVGPGRGGYALFVGRLTEEKGIETLLGAWTKLGNGLPLKIFGDGPMRDRVRSVASMNPMIEYLGRRPLDEIYQAMGDALFLVFPSTWYEGMPRTIIESFAKGTPVITSDLGSMAEMIEHGRTGWLFKAGDSDALADTVREISNNREGAASMRSIARNEYELKYSPCSNYKELLDLYAKAIAIRAGRTGLLSRIAVDRPGLQVVTNYPS